jgi:hypothetical protein
MVLADIILGLFGVFEVGYMCGVEDMPNKSDIAEL